MKKVRRTKENVIMKPRGLTRTVKFCLAPGALSDAIHELCKEARQVRNQLILIPNSFDEKISELRKNEEANKGEIELYSSLLPCVRSPGAIRRANIMTIISSRSPRRSNSEGW